MSEHRISLLMTSEIYYSGYSDKTKPDFSKHMVGLYPYAEGEGWAGVRTGQFDGQECEEVRLSLNATQEQEEGESVFPNELQQEYLRHLLRRELLLDVLVDDISIREALFAI